MVGLEEVSGRTAPVNMLWNSCVTPKVFFYAWEVWWGKVLTTKHLKEGFQLANRCPLCGKAEEELNHILIHCPSIWGLWEELISIPGIDWVCPLLAKDLLLGWSCFSIRKKARMIWKAAPLCLF